MTSVFTCEAIEKIQESEFSRQLEVPLDSEKEALPSVLTAFSFLSQPRIDDLSKYQISKVLGRGKFSLVLLSKEEGLEPVALRITRLKDAEGNKLSNISHEDHHKSSLVAQSLSDHPCIMKTHRCFSSFQEISILRETFSVEMRLDSKVVDFFTGYSYLSGFYFEECEYLSGLELVDELLSSKKTGPDSAQFVLANLIRMVKHLQQHRMIHRDLKLENIVLNAKGNLKLVDFGFAKIFDIGKELRTRTRCGTPEYAAPEVYKGEHYKAFPVDIWSVGIIAYIIMTGGFPFYKKNKSELRREIVNKEPSYELPCFQGDLQSTSVRMKSCIQGLLQKNPDRRLTVNELENHEALNELNLNEGRNWKLLEEGRFISPFLSKTNPLYVKMVEEGTVPWEDRTKERLSIV
jgi:serine/threonine protein kinase